MPPSAKDIIWDEVIKTRDGFAQFSDEFGSGLAKEIRVWMRLANDKVNSRYPMAHMMMLRSIDGKGALKLNAGHKFAKKVVATKEFKTFIKKKPGNFCISNTSVVFRSDRDVARSLYQAAISGDLEVREDKTYVFKGQVSDTYDFRFDLIPKNLTIKGAALRLAGNIAYVCQKLKLMKSYKVTIQLEASGKL